MDFGFVWTEAEGGIGVDHFDGGFAADSATG